MNPFRVKVFIFLNKNLTDPKLLNVIVYINTKQKLLTNTANTINY